MANKTSVEFPSINESYIDEFGHINPEVYHIGKDLWNIAAKNLAQKFLRDSSEGLPLMIKAIAKTSQIFEKKPKELSNLRGYLYKAYKNLVLAELEKRNAHSRRLLNREFEITIDENDELNKKILINELRQRMDEWTRQVFDLSALGYTYEDLVPKYGSAANVIRSRFSKNLSRLARKINSSLEQLDRKI